MWRTERRWLDASTALGALAWLVVLAVDVPSYVSIPLAERLVALGPLVVAPLAIEAGLREGLGPFGPRGLAALVVRAQPLAAAAVLGAVLLGTGAIPSLLAGVWLVESVLVALLGLARLAARGPRPLHELAVDAGHLYLPIGAAWFLASRLTLDVMGFGHVIVLLTAAHFHFAGLAAPVIVGQIGRLVPAESRAGAWYRAGAALVILGPILVALGITFSPLVEVATAALLAAGILLVAAVTVISVAFRAPQRMARALLGAAQLVSILTMALALTYALGEYLGHSFIAIHPMVELHGAFNALGYAVPSLVALRILSPARHGGAAEHAPFVMVPGRGAFIGPSHLDAHFAGEAPGLMPSLRAMLRVEHPDAAPHADVAAFYEDTAGLDLVCQPRWRAPFVLPARLFIAIARAMGQLVLPIAPRPHRIVSRLARFADTLSPRLLDGAISSVRTYEDGSAMYVAVYAEHEREGVRYMNIGMPLPFGLVLASILRGHPLPEGGLVLGSRPGPRPGDEGLFLARGRLRVRLPLHETLHAHAAESDAGRAIAARLPFTAEGATMVATHVFHVAGIVCLELGYAIGPSDRLVIRPANDCARTTPARRSSG